MMRGVITLLLVLAAVVAVQAKDPCRGKDYGVAGDFDLYVQEMSWSATFCKSKASWPGCQNPTRFMRTNLTLHGLWPQYASVRSGGHLWPQCCPTAFGKYFDPSVYEKYAAQLDQFWPNEQSPSPPPSQLNSR
jgi:ribonuclease I